MKLPLYRVPLPLERCRDGTEIHFPLISPAFPLHFPSFPLHFPSFPLISPHFVMADCQELSPPLPDVVKSLGAELVNQGAEGVRACWEGWAF